MQIEIHIPRPGVTLLLVAALCGWGLYFSSGAQTAAIQPPALQAQLIEGAPAGEVIVTQPAESAVAAPVVGAVAAEPGLTPMDIRMKWARAQQAYLAERETILRTQLSTLQKQREALGEQVSPEVEEEFRRSVKFLTSLVQDRQKAEEFLLAAYKQQWNIDEESMGMSAEQTRSSTRIALQCPVLAPRAPSARFLDAGYKALLHREHYGMDFPVLPGTSVLAAAPGTVRRVINNGYGVNAVIVDHGGFVTAYLHLRAVAVAEGQYVETGDNIAESEGSPGKPGSGDSTGAHLHFALYVGGVPADPAPYLATPDCREA